LKAADTTAAISLVAQKSMEEFIHVSIIKEIGLWKNGNLCISVKTLETAARIIARAKVFPAIP